MILINIYKLIFGIGLPIMLGYLLIEVVLSKKILLNIWEKMALAYGAGVGGLTLIMFFLSILKISFTLLNITLSIFLISLILLLFYIRARGVNRPIPKKQEEPLSSVDRFLVCVIISVSLYVLFESLSSSLASFGSWAIYDSWAIYGFKARSFYIERLVPVLFLGDSTKSYAHLDYPLLVPLLEAWLYICLGACNDQLVKVIFFLFFVSLITVFFHGLNYYMDRRKALLFTSLLVTIPLFVSFAGMGFADLPLLFYYFVSLVFLLRANKYLERNLLFVSAIFGGLAAWTKNEGLIICILNCCILFGAILRQGISRRALLTFVSYILIIVFIIIPWFWFKGALGIYNDVVNHHNLNINNILDNLHRLRLILDFIEKKASSFESWNLLWIFSLGIIILNLKKIATSQLIILLLSLSLYSGAWFFIYVISPYDINWHLATSADRLLLDMAPLILFLDGLVIFKSQRLN